MNPQIPKTTNLYKQKGMIHYVFSEETEGFLVASAIVSFLVEQILGGRDEGKRKRRLEGWWKKGSGHKDRWSQCRWMGQVRNVTLEDQCVSLESLKTPQVLPYYITFLCLALACPVQPPAAILFISLYLSGCWAKILCFCAVPLQGKERIGPKLTADFSTEMWRT